MEDVATDTGRERDVGGGGAGLRLVVGTGSGGAVAWSRNAKSAMDFP